MKLTQLKASLTQTVLVYGPPKVGKTELVGKLSEAYDLLWIDMESGVSTLLKLPDAQKEKIDVIQLPDDRTYPIAIETCLKIIRGTECFINIETGKVQPAATAKLTPEKFQRICLNELGPDTIVVFDSLTQLTNSAISHITKNQPDDYKLQYDDWGALGKLMDVFLSQVQTSKCNIVCISHETEAELEDGKNKIVPVAGTRNFSRNAAKYFGHVVYCQVANKKHTFSSSTTSLLNVLAGSRTDISTEKMGEPSLIPIFRGEVGETPKSNGQIAASGLQSKLAALKQNGAGK